MAILKDPSQLSFYISGLQRWTTIAEATGTSKKILADLALTLCKEMSEHFGTDISQNNEGIDKIVEWLKNKFGLKAHADLDKILNIGHISHQPNHLKTFLTALHREAGGGGGGVRADAAGQGGEGNRVGQFPSSEAAVRSTGEPVKVRVRGAEEKGGQTVT